MRFIGRKTLLLEDIKKLIDRKAPEAKIFCDIFSGSGTVARYFKTRYQIISNDLLYFSYVLQKGTIENDAIPKFNLLKKKLRIKDPINYLNSLDLSEIKLLDKKKCFFYNTYSPNGGRMYINDENALRIDYARNTVETWFKNNLLTEEEYFYLLACIIEGIPFVSNISGTYGAFHKTWDNRAYKNYELYRLDVDTNNKKNKCYNEDGVELLKKISGDILYMDPPYNSRQYLSNYHVLETAAKYDFPEVKGVTGQRKNDDNKSDFCMKQKALQSFENLIKNAKFKHLILSYSTDGLMDIVDIENIMKKYGKKETFEIIDIPYRRYKSSSNSKLKGKLSELLIYIEKDYKKGDKGKYIKCPLNYTGGKYKLIKDIMTLMPNNIDNFVDLFAGGLNVGINIDANTIYANDHISYLTDMYSFFKNNSMEDILDMIKNIITTYNLNKNNKEGYLKLRKDYNESKNVLELFVLTCFSFNHQIRFNNSHEYNVPFGKDRSSYNPSIEQNLIMFITALKNGNFIFSNKDFTEFNFKCLHEDDVVYCDPPYLITNASYNDGKRGFKNWTEKEELKLLTLLDELNKKDIKFILSNVFYHKGNSNELLINWSKQYNVTYIDKNYSNCSYNKIDRDAKTVEVLITNFKN